MIAYTSRFIIPGLLDASNLLRSFKNLVYDLCEVKRTSGSLLCEMWMKDSSVSTHPAYGRTFGLHKDRNEWVPLRLITNSYLNYIEIEENIASNSTILTVVATARGVLESITALVHVLYSAQGKIETGQISPAGLAKTTDEVIQFVEVINSETQEIMSRRLLRPISMQQLSREIQGSHQELLRVSVVPTLNPVSVELSLVEVDYESNRAELWLQEAEFHTHGDLHRVERIERLLELAKLLYHNPTLHNRVAALAGTNGHLSYPATDLQAWRLYETRLLGNNHHDKSLQTAERPTALTFD